MEKYYGCGFIMKNFIKSLKRPGNETLIEAVLKGYSNIFESVGEYQHILRKGTDIEKLKKEGFKSGIGPNVLLRWEGKPQNVLQMKYQPKEGDTILYVPKEWVKHTPNGPKIKDGFIPTDENIVTVENSHSINEANEYNLNDEKHVLDIGPETKLFHGTGEDFDVKDVRPGGYDSVFWTSTSSTIAQSYIPVSGLSIYTSSKHLLKPDSEFLEQLGIKPFTDIKKRGNEIQSYRVNDPYLIEIGNKEHEFFSNLINAEKKIKELKENYEKFINELDKNTNIQKKEEIHKEKKEMFKEIYDAQDEYEKILENYRNFNKEKLCNDYVNEKIEKLGYKPADVDPYRHDHRWRLKISSDGKILPATFREKGRLFVVTPKRQMKIYDIAGDSEPDLMDKQYHYIDVFNMIRKKGYDGVRINDFAQHETMGNVGHKSIGFFKEAIPDLDIKVIEDVSHPEGNELPIHTKEYEKWSEKMESFGNFIKSLKNDNNEALIESILKGYVAIYESSMPSFDVDVDSLTNDQLRKINNKLRIVGYNMHGPDDVKNSLIKQQKIGIFYDQDWKDAVDSVVEPKKSNLTKPSSSPNLKRKIAKEFGFTNQWKITGYIMQDGSQIDFSGRNKGNKDNTRGRDHAEIAYLLDNSNSKFDFIKMGNIRIIPECGGINLYVPPTKQQKSKLHDFIEFCNGEVTLDIGNGGLNMQYPEGTSPYRVLRDMDSFFAGNEVRPLSTVEMYH